jgi:hypothetical protein
LQRDAFLNISEGLKFLYFYETVQTPCVIFNQDEDSEFVNAGMRALIMGENKYGILKTLEPQNIFPVHSEYNLSSPSNEDAFNMIEDINTISEYVGFSVKLIGLDSQSDFMPDHDVSASAPSKLFFKRLKMIRKSNGVAVHIIHHDNRKGEYLGYVGSRNSSDRFTSLSRTNDVITRSYLSKDGKRRHGVKTGPQMKVRFHFKTVDGDPNSELKYVWASKPGDNEIIVDLPEYNIGKPENHILIYLSDHGASLRKDIEVDYGRTMNNSFSLLKKAEYIQYTEKTINSRWKAFELTENGLEYLEHNDAA